MDDHTTPSVVLRGIFKFFVVGFCKGKKSIFKAQNLLVRLLAEKGHSQTFCHGSKNCNFKIQGDLKDRVPTPKKKSLENQKVELSVAFSD